MSKSNSPSRRRRYGRESYDPERSPEEVCPYKKDLDKREDWFDGWYEAEKAHKRRKREEFEEELELEILRERILNE